MKNYLKAAVERYSIEDGQLIHPISDTDANIVNELTSIFRLIGAVVVSDVLDEYKLQKDSDILEKIKEIRKVVEDKRGGQKEEDKGKQSYLIRYSKFGQKRIDLFQVISYEGEYYNGRYCILLNPTPDAAKNVPMYANSIISFDSEKSRDEALSLLDNYFRNTRGMFLQDIVGK